MRKQTHRTAALTGPYWMTPTHDEMSNRMKARAFSWGVRSAVLQSPGNGTLGRERDPADTCMS